MASSSNYLEIGKFNLKTENNDHMFTLKVTWKIENVINVNFLSLTRQPFY